MWAQVPCCATFEAMSFEAAFGQLWGAFVQLSGSIWSQSRRSIWHLVALHVCTRVSSQSDGAVACLMTGARVPFFRKLPPGALKACVPIP